MTHKRKDSEDANARFLREGVAQNFAKARVAAGWSQTQAAAMLGVTSVTVSRWETGQRTPELSTVYDVASAYGVSPYSLLPETVSLAAGTVQIQPGTAEGSTDGTTL